MKKLTVPISIVFTLLLIAAVHFSYLYYNGNGDEASRRINIKVAPGTTFKQVQADLVEKGILTRPAVFRWAAYLTRRETKIKTGKYLFKQGESVASVLNKLVAGEVDYAKVVIPEGYMATEIASILQKDAEVDSMEFMRAVNDTALLSELNVTAASFEGYLFPDTYLLDWPISADDALRRMVRRFDDVYTEVVGTPPDSLELDKAGVVTLASIIQSEAVFESEMPRISAVYHNRLDAGWRLEADPTVAYALGGARRKLWYKDLKVDSPYNTYRVRGLPPGAICSPGSAALRAAAGPEPGSLDFYFVANGTGRHTFSRTYFEHLKAKHRMKYGPVPKTPKQKSYLEASGGKIQSAEKETPEELQSTAESEGENAPDRD